MSRRTGTQHPDGTGPAGPKRHPSPTEVVALVNGATASLGSTYLLTSSALITVLAGVLAAAIAALHFVSGS
ncbi:hypothetical protein V7793_14220 [Streptomyces sp. KLMMK]|uniref:hypothetical protein n=1 Tax=Streptomyces sp. KLMMK TaxID=3109353 RepID=UPI00300BE75A